MLHMTRSEGESIVINETITIKIVHAQDGVVNLEIDAPDEVVTVRQESVEEH